MPEAGREIALVTGATGFLGRPLCTRLRREGIAVRGLARETVGGPWESFLAADLTEPEVAEEAVRDVHTVFHLASKVHGVRERTEDEPSYRRINVDATRELLEAAVRAGVRRFIFFSSVKAMGEGGEPCRDETWKPEPKTAYGRAKLEGERVVLAAGARYDLHACVLRLPLVYGPGVKGNLLRMMEGIERGRLPRLPDTGNRRSLVHAEDVVQAALLAASHRRARGETYIVTDGEAYSTRRIYDGICLALGKSTPRWSIPAAMLRGGARVGDLIGWVRGGRSAFDSEMLEKLLGSAWYSSKKIERELGFRPSMHLEQALPEMIAAREGAPRLRVSV